MAYKHIRSLACVIHHTRVVSYRKKCPGTLLLSSARGTPGGLRIMLLDIDLREALLMIALVVLYGTMLYATYRSTKALKNEIAQKPEVPDIVQMASLEEATGFKVVDKDGYQSLQTLNDATSSLPGRVERVEQNLVSVSHELNDIKRSMSGLLESMLSLRQDTQDRGSDVTQAFSDLNENLRSAIAAIFQRLEEDAE